MDARYNRTQEEWDVGDAMLHLWHIPPHRCDFEGCPQTFNTIEELRTHKRQTHLLITECRDCLENFLTPAELATHRREVHKVGTQMACQAPGCGYRTDGGNRAFERHIKSQHSRPG